MTVQILAGPIIGAIIGYVTNKIAVEMLFHPHKPIYIGKMHIPFTPGIIPKGKGRLGRAIGEAVGNSLLTSDVIKESLLSQKIEEDIKSSLDLVIKNLTTDKSTVKFMMNHGLGEKITSHLENHIKELLTKRVSRGLITMDLGETVADEVLGAVQEKIQGTMLSMMINETTLAPIVEEIKIRINKYIEDHSEKKVGEFIESEVGYFTEQPVSSFFSNLNTEELKEVTIDLYRKLVNNYATQLLDSLNLSKVIEEKVCAMEIQEVEDLVLSIMKKELGAVVNLGAFIGFVLGLVNMIF